LISMLPFVSVHPASKAILLSLALRLDAAVTATVQPMKNVTMFLVAALLERNVNPFAILATVQLEQTAQPEITERLALADTPCKAMA